MKGNTLVLGGADIVDGSPVLDIKPYVPFCDGVQIATAPPWVAVRFMLLDHGLDIFAGTVALVTLTHLVRNSYLLDEGISVRHN